MCQIEKKRFTSIYIYIENSKATKNSEKKPGVLFSSTVTAPQSTVHSTVIQFEEETQYKDGKEIQYKGMAN